MLKEIVRMPRGLGLALLAGLVASVVFTLLHRPLSSPAARHLVAGLAAGLALPAGAQPTNALTPAPLPPNIIFILADDLGYGDLGCYGQKKIKTPNLDQLAAEGMRFTSFYAGSTVCAPSRAALMTGIHTGHAGIRGNTDNLALTSKDLTVATVLKKAGYHTTLIGKWGLGNSGSTGVPNHQGFDEYVGYLDQVHAHDYYTDRLWRFDPHSGYDGEMVFPENQAGKKGLYIPDVFTTSALNFLRINSPSEATPHPPFFLYLAYTIPHANNEEGRRSGNGMEVPNDRPYSGESWPQTEKNKAAMITRLDADIGRLIAKLKELKMETNTIVFFASDNGPHKEGGVDPAFFQSSGPLRGIKRDLYEGGIRVPMIARWPGRIQPGTVNQHMWAFWDFLPTAAALAGAPAVTNIDGISMMPTLMGQTQTNRHDFLYWEFYEGGFKQAARTNDWKAVRVKVGAPLELYDLRTDLAEQHDVAKQNAVLVERMETYLKTARTESDRWPIQAESEKK